MYGFSVCPVCLDVVLHSSAAPPGGRGGSCCCCLVWFAAAVGEFRLAGVLTVLPVMVAVKVPLLVSAGVVE